MRTIGAKNKPKLILIPLRELNKVLKEDTLIPVSRDFVNQLIQNKLEVLDLNKEEEIAEYAKEENISPRKKIEFEIL